MSAGSGSSARSCSRSLTTTSSWFAPATSSPTSGSGTRSSPSTSARCSAPAATRPTPAWPKRSTSTSSWRQACDLVVIEGTDFTGPSAHLEFGFNARVARHLGAPVVAVVNGHDRSVDDILEAVRVSEESLVAQGDSLIALIVNRVPPKVHGELVSRLAGEPVTAVPVWALPEDDALRYPTLAELGDALAAEVMAGDPDDLTREVRHVKVAAMSVPNLLDHLEEGTVLITPGDRPDVIVAAALTRHSAAVPSIAGVVLSGGLRPDGRVVELIAGFSAGGKPLPMFAVDADTFDTATAAAEVEGPITAGNERKIAAALGLFEANVDTGALEERIHLVRSTVVTPVMFQHELIERAKQAGARIVLPEGTEDRVLEAADRLLRRKVCDLTLLGPEAAVRQRISELGLELADVPVVDPTSSPWFDEFAERYRELRAHRGITLDRARDTHGRRQLLRHDDGPRGDRRRDGVGRRAHDRAHDPPGAGVHPHASQTRRSSPACSSCCSPIVCSSTATAPSTPTRTRRNSPTSPSPRRTPPCCSGSSRAWRCSATPRASRVPAPTSTRSARRPSGYGRCART